MPAAVSLWTKSVAQLNHAVLLWIAIFSNNSAAMAKLVNSDAIPEGYRAAKDGLTLSWEDQPLPDNADPAEHLKRSANTLSGCRLERGYRGRGEATGVFQGAGAAGGARRPDDATRGAMAPTHESSRGHTPIRTRQKRIVTRVDGDDPVESIGAIRKSARWRGKWKA